MHSRTFRKLLLVPLICFGGLCLAQSDQTMAPSLVPAESPSVGAELSQTEAGATESVANKIVEAQSEPQLSSQPQALPVPATRSAEELLSDLRDVYSPDKPSWWPLAPGWWGLAALFIGLTAFLAVWWRRRSAYRRGNDWKKSARAQLQNLKTRAKDKSIPSTDVIADASVLMRRVSLALIPREQVAALKDEPWLRALDTLVGSRDYSQGAGQLLTRHPYMRPHDIDPSEVDALLVVIGRTIDRAPPVLHDTGATGRV